METRRFTVVYADDDESIRSAVVPARRRPRTSTCMRAPTATEPLALCELMDPDAVLLHRQHAGVERACRSRGTSARRDASKSLRLVAMTGRGSWQLRKKAFDAGFNEFLTKPASRELILDVLRAPRQILRTG